MTSPIRKARYRVTGLFGLSPVGEVRTAIVLNEDVDEKRALLFHPAEAQTLKQTGVSIFNALYAVIGVVGAICVLVTGINWAAGNFLGAHDPKRLFFQVLAGTAIAFASVAIVQFIKEAVGGNGSIGNL